MHGHHHHIAAGDTLRRSLHLEKCDKVALLLGVPNSGKSALFNALTGGSARVGNWPGVTASILVGRMDGACIVDLPGVYGLGEQSLEASMVEEAILSGIYDRIVILVDSSAPERDLYLLVQVLEAAGDKVLVALSKYAVAHAQGVHIDVEGLRKSLGVGVVVTSALENLGLSELREAIMGSAGGGRHLRVDYGLIEEVIAGLAGSESVVKLAESLGVSPRWVAAQLTAGDPVLEAKATEMGLEEAVKEAYEAGERIRQRYGMDPGLAVSSARVRKAEEIASRLIVRGRPTGGESPADRVLLHPVVGPLAGVAVLFAVLLAAFSVALGFPLNVLLDMAGYPALAEAIEKYSLGGLIGEFFGALSEAVPPTGLLGGLLKSVIDGVGIVASFLPLIAVVTGFLALLDDSGVLARIGVSLHPLFSKSGLSGRTVYPIFVALGCNVPAIISSRLLSPSERVRAVLAVPFMICSARLVVVTTLAYAFVRGPLQQAAAVMGIYLLGVAMALLTARLVAWLQARRREAELVPELVMELPPLHRPSRRVVWWSVRDAVKTFLWRMGGPILVASMVISALMNFGPEGYTGGDPRGSFAAIIGRWTGSPLALIGVHGDAAWILGLGLLAGFLVKEVIVSTIAIATGISNPIDAVLALGITGEQAMAILVFASMYMPCIATLVTLLQETGSRRLAAAYTAYTLTVATILAYATYAILTLV